MMRLGAFLLVLLVYFSSGIGLTLYNKWIVSAQFYGFTYPVTLIFAHMISNTLLSGLALYCGPEREKLRLSPFHPSHIKARILFQKFVPIGLLFGADITLTNSAVPALIFITNLARGVDRTRGWTLRLAKVLNVLLICAGVACTARGEVDFEIRGFVAAVAATVAATAKLILIEHLLTQETQDVASTHTHLHQDDELLAPSSPMPLSPSRRPVPTLSLAISSPDGSVSMRNVLNGGAPSTKEHVSPSTVSPRQVRVSPNGMGAGNLTASSSVEDFPALQQQAVSRRGSTPQSTTAVAAQRMFSPSAVHALSSSNGIISSGGGGNNAGVGNGMGHATGNSGSSSYQRVGQIDDDDDADVEADMQRRLTPTSATTRSGGGFLTPVASPGGTLRPPPLCQSPGRSASPAAHLFTLGASSASSATQGLTAPHSHRLHPLLSLFYFAPVSAFALLPLLLWLEMPSLSSSRFVSLAFWPQTLGFVLLGSLMAFGLNGSELFVIRETSALTLCIFGVAKFILVIGLSAMAFGQKFTKSNQLGVSLTIAGLICYNWVKYMESKQAEEEAATAAAAANAETDATAATTAAMEGASLVGETDAADAIRPECSSSPGMLQMTQLRGSEGEMRSSPAIVSSASPLAHSASPLRKGSATSADVSAAAAASFAHRDRAFSAGAAPESGVLQPALALSFPSPSKRHSARSSPVLHAHADNSAVEDIGSRLRDAFAAEELQQKQ